MIDCCTQCAVCRPYTTIVVRKAGRDLAPQIIIVIYYDLNGDCLCKAETAMFVYSVSLHCPSDPQTDHVDTHQTLHAFTRENWSSVA